MDLEVKHTHEYAYGKPKGIIPVVTFERLCRPKHMGEGDAHRLAL